MSNTQQKSHPLSTNGKPILIIREPTDFINGVKKMSPSKLTLLNIYNQITEFYKRGFSDYNALCSILNRLDDLFFRNDMVDRIKTKKLRSNVTFWLSLYCIFYKKYHGITVQQALADYYCGSAEVKFFDTRERDIFITLINHQIILPRNIAA